MSSEENKEEFKVTWPTRPTTLPDTPVDSPVLVYPALDNGSVESSKSSKSFSLARTFAVTVIGVLILSLYLSLIHI